MVESISKKAAGRLNLGCAHAVVVPFLGLFCLVGIGVGTFLSFVPIYRAIQSRSWRGAACEVISSRVVHGDDTSRPDIQYRYHVDDRPYTGTRYNFLLGSDNISDYPSVVARYPPGHRFECYVDPADPTQAVISRELTFGYFFGLIFFVFFTLVPGGFIVGWFRAAKHLREKGTPSGPPADGGTAAAAFGSPARAAEPSRIRTPRARAQDLAARQADRRDPHLSVLERHRRVVHLLRSHRLHERTGMELVPGAVPADLPGHRPGAPRERSLSDAGAGESPADDHLEPGVGAGRRVTHDRMALERGGAPGQGAPLDARGT